MPSIICGALSGGTNVLSGAIWSGQQGPVGGIQFRWDVAASGNLYYGFSGGITVSSGGKLGVSGTFLSGLLDGMQVAPGDAFFIPKLRLQPPGFSGLPQLFVTVDAAASGLGRLFWEPM